MIENTLAGIVIIAQSFNPSIFTETWLDRNGIISADSLEGVRVFSPELAQFQTKDVQVQIIPLRMQITFSIPEVAEGYKFPLKIAARTIELLPHIPYQALGLNFDFFVKSPDEQDFNLYNRALLGTGDCKLLQEFTVADAKFGRYFSKDYGDARLRLDIKPLKAASDNKDLLQFSFNFNHDLVKVDVSERPKKLLDFIGQWEALRDYSKRLVQLGIKL